MAKRGLAVIGLALAGTGALRWLWTRVETAVSELASVARLLLPAPAPAPLAAVVVRDHERAWLPAQDARSTFVKRGPPIASSTRAF